MKDELISFETAKLAKEKGFKEFCSNGFDDRLEGIEPFGIGNGEISSTHIIDYFDNKGDNHLYARPTQSLLQRWLRDEFDIIVAVYHDTILYNVDIVSFYRHGEDIIKLGSGDIENLLFHNTYEERLEKGLQEALKLIK